MDLQIAESLVKLELNKHNLNNWNFQWNQAKTINGQCFYKKQIIKLSKSYVVQNPFKMIYNTILHEIAHALNYVNNDKTGHNRNWRNIFIGLGGNGQRCTNREVKPEPKHLYACQLCNKEIGTYRRLKNLKFKYHVICGKKGKFKKIK